MKRLSYTKIVYWFFGIVAAALAGLSLLLSFLDWNQYRVPLADLASSQMGMRVELAGDVSIGLFPRPRVSAEDVRLFPATESFSEVVATADRIGVNLGVSSLLQGRVSLQSMRLDGLDITLEETEGGHWRIRGWPETEEEAGPSIDLLRFNLVASRTTLLPLSGAVYPIDGISLALEGALPDGPLTWEGEFTAAGERITSSGKVRPVSVRDELSVKADFALADNSLSVSGRILPEGNLTGRIQINGSSLGGLVTNLAKIGQGKAFATPNLPYNLDVQVDKEGEITRLVSRNLTISDTRGRLDLTLAGAGKQNHVTGTISMGVIDFDNWLKATPLGEYAESDDNAESRKQILGGAIDIHIEGFQVRNGLGQRIDAVVGFGADGVNLSSISALLPGATNAAFTGKLGPRGGQGKLLVEAGNISELASWLGLAFPEGVPTGRLTTALLKADFTHMGENWMLSNISGQLDNTSVIGEIGGGLSKSGPWQIKVEADKLNLDAYLPETVSEQGVEAKSISLPDSTDIVFDISVNDLQLFDRAFNNTRFVGVLRDEKLDVSHIVSFQQQGKVELSGSVEQGQGQPKFDVSINLADWPAPVASYFVPNLPMMMQSLSVNTVNGTMTLVGAKDALNLGLDITSGENLLSLSGVVGLDNNTFSHLDLQGSFRHSDLAGLLRYNEIIDLKSLPVRASLNISKPHVDSALRLRMGGDAAGGDMTSDLLLQSGLRKLDLTYNHISVADFSGLTGLSLPGFDHAESLRSDLQFEAEAFPDDWKLSLNTLRNGDLSASGALTVTGAKQITGKIDLSGANINMQSSRVETAVSSVDILRELTNYSGALD
ncbi:MAG: AsmA family protein, partial [Kordiimonas sp.]